MVDMAGDEETSTYWDCNDRQVDITDITEPSSHLALSLTDKTDKTDVLEMTNVNVITDRHSVTFQVRKYIHA